MPDDQRSRLLIIFATLLLALVITRLPFPGVLTDQAVAMIAITLVGAIFWITECIPIALTALVIILLQAVFGITHISDGLRFIATPVNSIIFAGFIMARALSKHRLDRWIGLRIVLAIGERTDRLLLGVMAGTAFLSMWISNSAATAIMLPIVIGMMKMGDTDLTKSNLARAMTIGIAYAANIGGMGTPAGTPACGITIAFIGELAGMQIRFLDWFLRAFPVVFMTIPLAWSILMSLYPPETPRLSGGSASVRREIEELGPLTARQIHVIILFGLSVLLWILDSFVPLMPGWLYIASVLIALTFLAPVVGVVKWEEASPTIGWGIFILVGGGLALGSGLSETGIVQIIADNFMIILGDAARLTLITFLAVITAYSITFFSSLTATSTTFVPVAIALSYHAGIDPAALAMVVGLASCLAFLLPANTPPNAIAYATGCFRTSEMVKPGLILTFAAAVVLAVSAAFLWV